MASDVEALASDLRERIMDYGNHLTTVQGIDAARAVLASDWLAQREVELRSRIAAEIEALPWDMNNHATVMYAARIARGDS